MYQNRNLTFFIFLVLLSMISWTGASKRRIEDLVESLLYPRPPDTPGIRRAQEEISRFFSVLSPAWSIESNSFIQETVLGPINFTNMIAHFRPQCDKYIVLG